VIPSGTASLCLRPSTHPYTQSLVASLIIAEGEERATEIVQSWVDNDPLYINSDTDIYKAVADGECDVAIANTYYLGRLLTEDPDFPVEIVWPGAGRPRRPRQRQHGSGHRQRSEPRGRARRCSSGSPPTVSQQFADANFEYPADPSVEPNEIVAGLGEFTADLPAIRQLGANQPAAVEVLSAAGYE
jgi:iron(III) transport system substrate-binding protein